MFGKKTYSWSRLRQNHQSKASLFSQVTAVFGKEGTTR
jgi:DNA polymerase III psi subunit